VTARVRGHASAEAVAARFREAWNDLLDRAGGRAGEGVVVALGGGVDSMALLHLLRFSRDALPPGVLSAAHLDHAVREDGGRDARWMGGVCRAWGVPFHTRCLGTPPAGEAEARAVRYNFLDQVRGEVGARWIVTGHHLDDQAETVLFRALRGAGPGGLVGIHQIRGDGVIRPLLGFSRVELARYARAVGLAWREDPTNEDVRNPRNWIRRELLPELESRVVPGATASLVRLGELAAQDEGAWATLLPELMDRCVLGTDEGAGRIQIDRDALSSFHPGVQARVLRDLTRRLGKSLDHAGTRAGLEFVRAGDSGREAPLGGDIRLARDFGTLILSRMGGGEDGGGTEREGGTEAGRAQSVCEIPALTGGSGQVGKRAVAWGSDPGDLPPGPRTAFPGSKLVFPLTLRPWRPGDRLRLPYGTKKVKKLLAEARVGASVRERALVLADASGHLLWLVGVASTTMELHEGDETFHIGVARDAER